MGKFTDKFLNALNLGDDYDDYDDWDDDYDDEPIVSRKSKKSESAVDKRETLRSERVRESKPNNSLYDYDDDVAATAAPKKNTRAKSTKVVPMRGSRSDMEVCVIKPSTFEDAIEITDTLLSGKAVVLNLEGIHVDLAQRIIDFASGSCYAIKGKLQKISNYIFVITPETVDISGDFNDVLGRSGFDISTL